MVAYLLTPAGAQVLLELAEKIAESPGPTQYSTWDSKIEEFLRVRKLDGYLPWRNYGEHGGKPNSEHKKAGLSSVHRADLLYGKFAFTPIYAEPKKYSSLIPMLCNTALNNSRPEMSASYPKVRCIGVERIWLAR